MNEVQSSPDRLDSRETDSMQYQLTQALSGVAIQGVGAEGGERAIVRGTSTLNLHRTGEWESAAGRREIRRSPPSSS